MTTSYKPQPGDLLAARVLRLTQFNGTDTLFWRMRDGERDRLDVYVDVSDVFAWGCADAELVTDENIGRLEATFAEVAELAGSGIECQTEAGYLFAARERGLRPQGAVYEYIDERLHSLFDAAGPERVVGVGNPKGREA